MKNATHLSRMQLKAFQGGVMKDPCANMTGADLQNCQFNVCMAGWDTHTHSPDENKDKVEGCDKATQPAT